ncbi:MULTISPECIES: transcription/translation regulatory transformer protein RfaH [unclassified Pseudomonas]|uniref:transcription/translation regulatory transformer protein RfaH n=1 Tax=unclassified Pseudomonas TaxID=196821 RepID=UPI0016571F99|nr:transcription/translation regulatory transformer protein RfaH [Pseudomonas sp. N40(2020)]MBC8998610.1 transcription/translation regulatory transformer protein RfaH [Pseudomonas sp. N40(2020)]
MPATSSDRPNWYLLQCKPRQDERAHLNLLQQNYVVYHPQLVSERVIRGKRQRVLESLFPGYLFIQLSRNDNWAPLRSTRGVSRIVEFNHGPATVAEHVIEHLRGRCLESESDADEALKPGEHLQIISGPLSPLEGVFVAAHGTDRVMILLQFLNREQSVCLPLSVLERQQPSYQTYN